MTLAVYAWTRLMPVGQGILALLCGIASGVLVYALTLRLLRVPELDSALGVIRNKLRR